MVLYAIKDTAVVENVHIKLNVLRGFYSNTSKSKLTALKNAIFCELSVPQGLGFSGKWCCGYSSPRM